MEPTDDIAEWEPRGPNLSDIMTRLERIEDKLAPVPGIASQLNWVVTEVQRALNGLANSPIGGFMRKAGK